MQGRLSLTILVSTLLLFCTLKVQAQTVDLTLDRYASPYMGANLMIGALRAYQATDEISLSSSQGNHNLLMIAGRSVKFLAEWSLSSLAMVAQHEVFGHGARAREFHLANVSYKVNFFSGYTRFSSVGYNGLNVNQKAALATGGMEATTILSGQIQQLWFAGDSIDSREAAMYLVNSLDQSRYVFGTKNNRFSADNDVYSYVTQVNAWQGQGGKIFNITNLKRKIKWDYFDPMLYYSVYALYNYVLTGENTINFSRLFIKSYSFMPTTRTLLAPWGPELQLQNHLYSPDKQYLGIYFRTGRTGGKMSHGADIILKPIASFDYFTLDNKLSVWHQPHILKNTSGPNTTDKFGFADFISIHYQISVPVSLMAEVGYKTSGFLPGTPLARGLVWRLGFNLKYGC
jgi:hypothetical protein